jgi:hypothetical protein
MPTALDNGQRSPRKLLRAVIARLLGGKRGASSIEDRDVNKRVALVARLLPGSSLRSLRPPPPFRKRSRPCCGSGELAETPGATPLRLPLPAET